LGYSTRTADGTVDGQRAVGVGVDDDGTVQGHPAAESAGGDAAGINVSGDCYIVRRDGSDLDLFTQLIRDADHLEGGVVTEEQVGAAIAQACGAAFDVESTALDVDVVQCRVNNQPDQGQLVGPNLGEFICIAAGIQFAGGADN